MFSFVIIKNLTYYIKSTKTSIKAIDFKTSVIFEIYSAYCLELLIKNKDISLIRTYFNLLLLCKNVYLLVNKNL